MQTESSSVPPSKSILQFHFISIPKGIPMHLAAANDPKQKKNAQKVVLLFWV